MAKGRKTGGKNFVKGVVTNPNGRPPLAPEVRQARQLTHAELQLTINELIHLDKDQLAARMKDPKSNMLTLIMGSILAKAGSHGDQGRLDFILNRLVGKVKEQVEVTSMAVVERAKELAALPQEELIKMAEKELGKWRE